MNFLLKGTFVTFNLSICGPLLIYVCLYVYVHTSVHAQVFVCLYIQSYLYLRTEKSVVNLRQRQRSTLGAFHIVSVGNIYHENLKPFESTRV